jgi:hypothetical protein
VGHQLQGNCWAVGILKKQNYKPSEHVTVTEDKKQPTAVSYSYKQVPPDQQPSHIVINHSYKLDVANQPTTVCHSLIQINFYIYMIRTYHAKGQVSGFKTLDLAADQKSDQNHQIFKNPKLIMGKLTPAFFRGPSKFSKSI